MLVIYPSARASDPQPENVICRSDVTFLATGERCRAAGVRGVPQPNTATPGGSVQHRGEAGPDP